MILKPNSKLVMIGDSVTDYDRTPAGEGMHEDIGRGYGGYVAQVDALLMTAYPEYAIRVINRGVSGNTVRDLTKRWQEDVINLNPSWVSIMIGINDVWRQFDTYRQSERRVLPEEYGELLEELVIRTKPSLEGIILMTPYYIEPNREEPMRAKMDEYGIIVKNIAERHKTIFIDTQAAFGKVLKYMHSSSIAWDRVHPNHIGNIILATAFLNKVGFDWSRL